MQEQLREEDPMGEKRHVLGSGRWMHWVAVLQAAVLRGFTRALVRKVERTIALMHQAHGGGLQAAVAGDVAIG